MESFKLSYHDHPTSEQAKARVQLASIFSVGSVICIVKLRLFNDNDINCKEKPEIDCSFCPIMQSFPQMDIIGVSHRIMATHERYGGKLLLK